MIDTDKYEGHLASEGQTWAWSKWMLKNAETIEQHKATSALLNDAPLLLEEVKRLREGILNVMAGIYDNMYDMNQALDRVMKND
jgi:hypothetical protein